MGLEEVAEWQAWQQESAYLIELLDDLRVKIRDEGFVRNKAIYLALGIQTPRIVDRAQPVVRQLEGP